MKKELTFVCKEEEEGFYSVEQRITQFERARDFVSALFVRLRRVF
jgi:hypothetical protein